MRLTEQRPTGHGRLRGLITAVCGVVTIAAGLLIPSQFKSLPLVLVEEAGLGSPGVVETGHDLLERGEVAASVLLAEAGAELKLEGVERLTREVAGYIEVNPDVAVWGEWDPFLEQAFRGAEPGVPGENGVIGQFISADARERVLALLSNSRSPTVRVLLATRDLTTYRRFMPVFSAAGQPLEATINLTALLTQSEQFSTNAAREIRAMAGDALATGEAAGIERLYADLLSLGRRFNWGQMTALVRPAATTETFGKLRQLLQRLPEARAVLFASCLLAGNPDAVADYIIRYGDVGLEAMSFALRQGRGGVLFLLRQNLPPSGDFPDSGAGTDWLSSETLGPVLSFAVREPGLALGLKYGLYLLGAFCLFWSFESFSGLTWLAGFPAFAYVRRGMGAVMVCLFLVLINEPYLAQASQLSGYEFRIVIPVLGQVADGTLRSQQTDGVNMDIATVLSIVFFFILQLLVYLICLLKISEVDRKPVPNLVKLRLMENEENLFDSGLYVGIAGTSAALVLQVLGLIEANLLAAYASNLFGILCVAFVKIRHVRPYKTRLIEISQEQILAEVAPGKASI